MLKPITLTSGDVGQAAKQAENTSIVNSVFKVMQLRRNGNSITTTWTRIPTESGHLHRVGLYVLVAG